MRTSFPTATDTRQNRAFPTLVTRTHSVTVTLLVQSHFHNSYFTTTTQTSAGHSFEQCTPVWINFLHFSITSDDQFPLVYKLSLCYSVITSTDKLDILQSSLIIGWNALIGGLSGSELQGWPFVDLPAWPVFNLHGWPFLYLHFWPFVDLYKLTYTDDLSWPTWMTLSWSTQMSHCWPTQQYTQMTAW